jgi:hypothetical protein
MNLAKALDLMFDLMRQHGVYDQDWRPTFDRSVRRLGNCNYGKKIISLSQHATLVNDEAAVRLTILHEIAHALCGFHEGHGPVWKAKCLEIGGDGKRCGNIAVKAPHKYQMWCEDCRYTWKYYRRPKVGPCYIHKCQALLQRIGYTSDKPWVPVPSNLKVEALA